MLCVPPRLRRGDGRTEPVASGACRAGNRSRLEEDRSLDMANLSIAQRNAWSLAKTLMVCVVLFKTSNGFGVMPTAEYDGDATCILCEYDPFNP
jgi:hypothetical protein